MTHIPHALIEGMIVGSYALGANTSYIYVRGECLGTSCRRRTCKRRNASGSCTKAMIRWCPNGETRRGETPSPISEYIGYGREPGELKHLSNQRKGNRRDSVSSGERKRRSLNQWACLLGLWGIHLFSQTESLSGDWV